MSSRWKASLTSSLTRPVIAVPTTYAGSEMTPIWGLTEHGLKRTGRDPRILPKTVLYDPELTISLPPQISGPSGMNAIAHCVEALYAKDGNPIISLMAEDAMRAARYDLALPPEVPWAAARQWTDRGFDALNALEAAGAITIAGTTADIESGLSGARMVAVPHIEGAEVIDRDFECLHAYYAQGLRSLGPVWSRPTIWGHGVPFRFPSSPDTGPGLSEAGKALIRACNDLGVMVDLSHLNEKGFDAVLRHVDHLLSFLGEDGVALGSDFDGALVPRPLRDCAGLPRLVEALRGHGFDDALLKRIAHGNWLRVLRRTWRGASA